MVAVNDWPSTGSKREGSGLLTRVAQLESLSQRLVAALEEGRAREKSLQQRLAALEDRFRYA